ncbi:unnamed protein product [Urochloa decumbens]|uniref:DUF6598 domain-containing protein n=1 Tax=Urochloa decumbens TaxID=240449 RepID=A0ABC9CQC1_9POAL
MAAVGVLAAVAAAGSGSGCDEDEEYCPGLEPFFFDEAEAIADHERRLRRQQEEARKEERRVWAEKVNMAVRNSILDYDIKQDGQYYNRFYFADFSKFDLDEESPVGPMRYTDRVCDEYWPNTSVNILSVKIASLDVDWPIYVYGTVIARDSIDHKCIYLFRRDKDHCQLITSSDQSLILTGPKRGLALMGDMHVEIDLKMKDLLGQEEELSKGFSTIRGIAGRHFDKCNLESQDLATRLSTMVVTYAVVHDAAEATILIEVTGGEFFGKITACTTSIPSIETASGPGRNCSSHKKEGSRKSLDIVLHDSNEAGENCNGKGVIQLLRSTISLSQEEDLLVTFVDKTGNHNSLSFTPDIFGRVEAETTVGLTSMLVKVAWSLMQV